MTYAGVSFSDTIRRLTPRVSSMYSSSVSCSRPVLRKPGAAADTQPLPPDVAPTAESGESARDTEAQPVLIDPSWQAPVIPEPLPPLPPLVVSRDSALAKELFTDWRFDC